MTVFMCFFDEFIEKIYHFNFFDEFIGKKTQKQKIKKIVKKKR